MLKKYQGTQCVEFTMIDRWQRRFLPHGFRGKRYIPSFLSFFVRWPFRRKERERERARLNAILTGFAVYMLAQKSSFPTRASEGTLDRVACQLNESLQALFFCSTLCQHLTRRFIFCGGATGLSSQSTAPHCVYFSRGEEKTEKNKSRALSAKVGSQSK